MIEKNEVKLVFDLGSSLTIAEVAGLQQSLLDLFATKTLLTLDGSRVEQVDGAGVQLLAAFVKEAAKRRIEICWSGVSPSLRSAVKQLGLDAMLGLEVNA